MACLKKRGSKIGAWGGRGHDVLFSADCSILN